jgi:hypothetical protein
MGRQGEKMCNYGTDYILQRACSLPHVAVWMHTRHRVVTTTYNTYFLTCRGLNRSGEKRESEGGGGVQTTYQPHTCTTL